MKGIAQYILILLVTTFVVIFSFYLLSQLLSKEEEVSVISRSFASAIDRIEYSKSYFIRMIENEYSMFKGKLKDEEIANRLKKEYKIEISGVSSNFEVHKVDIEDGKFRLEINFNSFYSDSIFRIEANDTFTLYLN
jgi:hypothetical protein